MKSTLLIAAAALLAPALSDWAADKDTHCYEMRIYYAAPGKLEAVNARLRNHAFKLFEKHGMVNIGYWVPVDNTENKVVYLLAYPSRATREESWKAFMADPDWQAAFKASEVNGKLVARFESIFLEATDFSPAIKPSKADPPRLFELRTYTASPGNLDNLLARFREHTVKLFEKYGLTNFGYWTPTDKQAGAGEKLVYILAHQNKEAADTSWKGFRADPEWVAVKKASEDKAGGSLTAQDGVKSEFMTPTDYSPTR